MGGRGGSGKKKETSAGQVYHQKLSNKNIQ